MFCRHVRDTLLMATGDICVATGYVIYGYIVYLGFAAAKGLPQQTLAKLVFTHICMLVFYI